MQCASSYCENSTVGALICPDCTLAALKGHKAYAEKAGGSVAEERAELFATQYLGDASTICKPGPMKEVMRGCRTLGCLYYGEEHLGVCAVAYTPPTGSRSDDPSTWKYDKPNHAEGQSTCHDAHCPKCFPEQSQLDRIEEYMHLMNDNLEYRIKKLEGKLSGGGTMLDAMWKELKEDLSCPCTCVEKSGDDPECPICHIYRETAAKFVRDHPERAEALFKGLSEAARDSADDAGMDYVKATIDSL